MEQIRIEGGVPLNGVIEAAGAKNTILKLMVASLLTDQPVHLQNAPDVADVSVLARVLDELGVEVCRQTDQHTASLHARLIRSTHAPYDLVRKMRASVLVFGPLLARCGEATVSLPGGCAIGTRPLDLHIDFFRKLGAIISLENGYLHGTVPDRLYGTDHTFPKVSVGATEHAIMTATLADGTTVIRNAAREPEIIELAQFLNRMGAEIRGAGTGEVTIEGTTSLTGTRHRVLPDRIEVGTYAIAAAITGGKIRIIGGGRTHLGEATDVLEDSGVRLVEDCGSLTADRLRGQLKSTDATTNPFPGFTTDLQAQFMALMTISDGVSCVHEQIFENRFMHVPELMRMGADIRVDGARAIVQGVPRLKGAPVMATDLRASVCLVLAGLAAEGQTIINRVYHLHRGYENLVEKLARCGANIARINR